MADRETGSAIVVRTDARSDLAPRWTTEQQDVLRRTIARDCDDEEFALFGLVCARTGLDPFARQIYAISRQDSRLNRKVMTIQFAIDGLRLIAQRSGAYEGQVGPLWCGQDGRWVDVWLSDDPPAAAKVGIMRRGFREPLFAVATWRQFAQYYWDKGKGKRVLAGLWAGQLAPHMLAIRSEALALRRGFTQELAFLESGQLGAGLSVQNEQLTAGPAATPAIAAEVIDSREIRGAVDPATGEITGEDEPTDPLAPAPAPAPDPPLDEGARQQVDEWRSALEGAATLAELAAVRDRIRLAGLGEAARAALGPVFAARKAAVAGPGTGNGSH